MVGNVGAMAASAEPVESTASGPGLFSSPWRVVLSVAVLVWAVIVVRNIVTEAHQVIGWAIASSVAALLLAPVVAVIDRHVPRAVAIVATFVFVIAVAVGVVAAYDVSVRNQVDQIATSAPGIAERIEERDDRIGEIARDVGLAEQVEELTNRLSDAVGSPSDTLRSAALAAPPYFVSMILTIFLLLFGPRIVRGGLDQLSEARRTRLAPALREATRRTQGYVWASAAQAATNAAAILVVGALLDVPAVALVAMFGAVFALVPYVGVVVGWLPVLVLGLGTASLPAVLVAAAVAIALQAAEVIWWRQWVDGRTLHVGPAVVVIVAVLGYGVYGIGASLVACVLAVFGLALADQLQPGDPLPTPFDDPAGCVTPSPPRRST